VFQVLEPQQDQQQEVARAAGRVEDPEIGEPGEEALQEPMGRVLLLGAGGGRLGGGGFGHESRDLGFPRRPRVAEWIKHHRIDQAHDRAAVGVVGAQLAALVWV
jgi:hypothetical protein